MSDLNLNFNSQKTPHILPLKGKLQEVSIMKKTVL